MVIKTAAVNNDEKFVDDLVLAALREDLGTGDQTTDFLIDKSQTGTGRVMAKERIVLSGSLLFARVFQHLSREIETLFLAEDGALLEPGRVFCEVTGPYHLLLSGERTALNFMQHLCGIATLTRQYVERIKPFSAVLMDTRKTTPGFRLLEKRAVRDGGGTNHRFGLYDAVLIKENHITACGGIKPAVEKAIGKRGQDINVEVEVKNLTELEEALAARPDMIMLDNMSCDMMRHAVERVAGRVPLEASGNVTLETVTDIAATGVSHISVGALTHSAGAADISMLIETGTRSETAAK